MALRLSPNDLDLDYTRWPKN